MVMDNNEAISFWKREHQILQACGDANTLLPIRMAAIEQAIKALESIEELKRLCKKCATELNEYGDSCSQDIADHLQAVVDFINGDLTELKKLAGEG